MMRLSIDNLNGTVLMGYQAGYNAGGDNNTCMGFMSCKEGATNNTALGYRSAMSASGGENTVMSANSGVYLLSSNSSDL